MNREERVQEIRKLLFALREEEKESKKIIEKIIELAKPLEGVTINLRDFTITERETGGI